MKSKNVLHSVPVPASIFSPDVNCPHGVEGHLVTVWSGPRGPGSVSLQIN